MRTVTYKALRDAIFADLNYTSAAQTDDIKAQLNGYLNMALDVAYPWLQIGWPELRKATSETVTSQVIDLANVGTGLYFGVSRVLSVSKNHPWKSSNPVFYDFSITNDGVVVDDTVNESSLWVAHIEAPPVLNHTEWVTATPYVVGDVRFQTADCYYCLVNHTSGVFATDLANAKWVLLPIPAFLQMALRTSIAAAMQGAAGQIDSRGKLMDVLQSQLSMIADLHVSTLNP